ncbi:Prefoldin subunit 5 [Bonamia ostreae]|uniref:Prefoldin subunit 5 n=1 Tax=Bonamia ostreae TaxID=126728 RepID=A0ABV2APB3_9EUKA
MVSESDLKKLESCDAAKLSAIRQNHVNEINRLAEISQSLANYNRQYLRSKVLVDAVKKTSSEETKEKTFIPLTSAVFVRGEYESPSNFIVDVGANYLLERGYEATTDYLERSLQYCRQSLERTNRAIKENNDILKAIEDIAANKEK